MSTDRQRAANRRNAQRSTGPRTTRGRAAVRSNHLQHGFLRPCRHPRLRGHCGYHAVLDDYLADLHPAGAVETELVHRSSWNSGTPPPRTPRTHLPHRSIDRAERDVDAETSSPDELAAYAFEHWVESQFLQFKSEAPIERLSHLEYRLRRSADATLRLLRDLQSERLASSGPFAEIASAGPDTLVYRSTPSAAGVDDPTVAVESSAVRRDPQPAALSTTGPPAPATPSSSVHPAGPPSAPPAPVSPSNPLRSSTIHKPTRNWLCSS